MYVCIDVCMYFMYVFYVCVYVYVCVCVSMYVCVYVCMHAELLEYSGPVPMVIDFQTLATN